MNNKQFTVLVIIISLVQISTTYLLSYKEPTKLTPDYTFSRTPPTRLINHDNTVSLNDNHISLADKDITLISQILNDKIDTLKEILVSEIRNEIKQYSAENNDPRNSSIRSTPVLTETQKRAQEESYQHSITLVDNIVSSGLLTEENSRQLSERISRLSREQRKEINNKLMTAMNNQELDISNGVTPIF